MIRLPPRSLNPNAYVERFVRFKAECLNRMISFGEVSLHHAVREYIAHYHTERNHQGLKCRLIALSNVITLTYKPIPRLDGQLRDYYREAA